MRWILDYGERNSHALRFVVSAVSHVWLLLVAKITPANLADNKQALVSCIIITQFECKFAPNIFAY
jgi:hypothetical protein